MSLAEVIARLSKPSAGTVAVSRQILLGAGILLVALACWAAVTAWYLVFRDDVAAHLIARESAVQQAYEDKIAALRVHLDRLATQNLVDQDGLDRRVTELIARQAQLETRQSILGTLSERSMGKVRPATVQAPDAAGLALSSALPGGSQGTDGAKPTPVPESFGLRLRGSEPDASSRQPRRTSEHDSSKAPLRERIAQVQRSLVVLEAAQLQALDHLLRTAETRASRIRDALRDVGLNPDALDGSVQTDAVGGPLVPLATGANGSLFDSIAERVRLSVDRLAYLDRAASALPLGRPMPGGIDLTSAFGYRIDPFTRGPAMHTGLDFRADHGASVRASGAGQVIGAEYAGGYGNMVEIDHGNGVSTRYAHLSSIAVSPGQMVAASTVIGRVGSTGRSTGAHLHYETRIDGEAVDPQRFLQAGSRLLLAERVGR